MRLHPSSSFSSSSSSFNFFSSFSTSSFNRFLSILIVLLVVQSLFSWQIEAASENKFRTRRARQPDEVIFGKDATSYSKAGKCHHEVNLMWRASLGSGVSSTPLIADLRGNGDRELVASTTNYFVEVIEGHNGRKEAGWPYAFASSSFSSSPLLYDINKDGVDDIVVSTTNGEIVFLNQNGLPSYGKTLKIPPIKIEKLWYEGLTGNNFYVSLSLSNSASSPGSSDAGRRKLLEEAAKKTSPPSPQPATETKPNPTSSSPKTEGVAVKDSVWQGFGGSLTPEGIESLELFLPSDTPGNFIDTDSAGHQLDPLFSEQFPESKFAHDSSTSHVWVDAHILATPVIADIDGDKIDDLIVPVSYYFDRTKYENPAERRKLGLDIDITKYIAGGIVIFDLGSLTIKREIPLDVTLEGKAYNGYLSASPTIVDLDRDGNLDIIVPTGVGYIYVIDSDGKIKTDGFPLMMDAVFGEVGVADLLGDGKLELVVSDAKSNLAVFDNQGQELWETRVSGATSSAPVFGDVDADGVLDIVIGTTAGHVWAIRGDTGKVLPHFPVKVAGQLYGRALLLDLGGLPQLQIIMASTDGHMYIVDGKTGCVDRMDIGEPSLTSVLADDVTGNGMVDLVVTTSSGSVFTFDTSTPYHPTRSWTGQNLGVGSFVAKNYQSIYVSHFTRDLGEVVGETFPLEFVIVDERPLKPDSKPHYRVKAFVGRELIFEREYSSAGVYRETIPAPNKRLFTTVTVEMLNEFNQHFFDSFSINFNVYFYRTLKYILLLPFCLMVLALLYSNEHLSSSSSSSSSALLAGGKRALDLLPSSLRQNFAPTPTERNLKSF